MLKIKFSILILFINVFTEPISAQEQNKKLNAVEVIEKAIEIKGGKDFLKGIKTLYIKSECKFTIDIGCKYEVVECIIIDKYQLPNKSSRSIIIEDSLFQKIVYDGKNRFEIPHREVSSKSISNSLNIKSYEEYIFNELDYLNDSIWKVELLDDDVINNEEVYKISAKHVTGIIRILYYSKSTFDLLTSVDFENEDAKEYITIDYWGYKNFGELRHYSRLKNQEDIVIEELKIIDLIINEKVTKLDFK